MSTSSIARQSRPFAQGAAFSFACLLLSACAPVSPYYQGGTVARQKARSNPPRELSLGESGHALRVLLHRGAKGLRLSSAGGLSLAQPRTGQVLAQLSAGGKARLEAKDGRIYSSGQDLGTAELTVRGSGGHAVLVKGITYRGELRLRASGSELMLLNVVDLDEYLYGVLPSEIPASWPTEALKAQAVAARTYALWRAKTAGRPQWDLDDSTASQAYLGRSKENERTNEAVERSRGLVLGWKGSLAQTFFHSNSGGATTDAASVWGSDLPYLRGGQDPYSEEGKHFAWTGTVSTERLNELLTRSGRARFQVDDLRPVERDESGRYRAVLLRGDGRELRLRSSDLRSALGADLLRSTNFQVTRRGENFVFEGRGWGHGVGLAQEGAQAMAKQGSSYKRILDFYYPGTDLVRIY